MFAVMKMKQFVHAQVERNNQFRPTLRISFPTTTGAEKEKKNSQQGRLKL